MSEKNSYRQIIKATSLFGGVEVVKILIKIIQSKVMAVLLGPAGIGVFTLLQSSSRFVEALTNFGLKTSSVRSIASVNETGNNERTAVIVTVLHRLVWITGILGAITIIILSPWLSKITFGNSEYTLAFIWISITLLFNQISSGQLVILQGLRKIKYLANANLTGAFLGLIISLPLYYLFEVDGIVPAIIFTSLANMFRSWYFAAKVKLVKVNVDIKTTIIEGKEMLILGFVLSISGLISLGASFLLRIFISNTGGVDQVGLYGAGFMIINTYVGLVFSAMGTDYFPRLSSIASDNFKARQTINQQAEISILILAPILIVFLIFINWVVILLYSKEFIEVSGMIQWAAIGMFFKAASWSIAFIFLAKGTARIFFWNELITNIYLLAFNILGYKYGGLEGLGISFLISYAFYLIQVFVIAKIKYKFSFNRGFIKIFLFQLLLGVFGLIISKFINSYYSYLIGSILILVSGIYSIYELNKRLDFKSLINKKILHK